MKKYYEMTKSEFHSVVYEDIIFNSFEEQAEFINKNAKDISIYGVWFVDAENNKYYIENNLNPQRTDFVLSKIVRPELKQQPYYIIEALNNGCKVPNEVLKCYPVAGIKDMYNKAKLTLTDTELQNILQ
jgi:hypothetical protein